MKNRQTAFLLRCPAIPLVRIALIGLGRRGMKTLQRYAYIRGAQITYLVDLDAERLEEANENLLLGGRPPAQILCGQDSWKDVCDRPDVDLVYICTEWHTHAEMAVYAMQKGKHVAVEVPAATTVDECWQLVHTAEKTQRHCFMTENCCYDFFALGTLEMHRKGMFGEITHCEGAYIHDLTASSSMLGCACDGNEAQDNWIERACLLQGGNPYPTHAIGPIAQLLGFHRRDNMSLLVSLSSRGAKGTSLPIGSVNTTLVQTVQGVSIMLQLDVTTHRPYSRLQTVCGTQAYVQKYPLPTIQIGEKLFTGEDALDRMERLVQSDTAALWREGNVLGVPNAMNYAMDARLIHCLNCGLPLDIDVYDAAEWSCLVELTKKSADSAGKSVQIPCFL